MFATNFSFHQKVNLAHSPKFCFAKYSYYMVRMYIHHETAACASQDGSMLLTNQSCVFTKLSSVFYTIAMHTLLFKFNTALLFGTLVVALTIV